MLRCGTVGKLLVRALLYRDGVALRGRDYHERDIAIDEVPAIYRH